MQSLLRVGLSTLRRLQRHTNSLAEFAVDVLLVVVAVMGVVVVLIAAVAVLGFVALAVGCLLRLVGATAFCPVR